MNAYVAVSVSHASASWQDYSNHTHPSLGSCSQTSPFPVLPMLILLEA